MEETFEQRVSRARALYSEEKMKTASAQLIEAYRRSDVTTLNAYAQCLGLPAETDRRSSGKLFMKLIMNYHPDRYHVKQRELDDCLVHRDAAILEKLEKAMNTLDELAHGSTVTDDLVNEEEYVATAEDIWFDNDLGYEYEDENDEWAEEVGLHHDVSDPEDEGIDFGFIEALRAEIFGNLDFVLLPKDLMVLDGEIALQARGIYDLSGIEYCSQVTAFDLSWNKIADISPLSDLDGLRSLDLSHNQIEDVSSISSLHDLEVLDIAHNEIEDISDLVGLGNLRFLNLVGNPVLDRRAVAALRRRGTVVVI